MKITLERARNGWTVVQTEEPPHPSRVLHVARNAPEALHFAAVAMGCEGVLAEDLLARHVEFTFSTFGPGPRLKGTLAHIREELDEIEAEPHKLEEWVDVILLAVNGAARHGHDAGAIAAGILAKIRKNAARDWPAWQDMPADAPINHVRD